MYMAYILHTVAPHAAAAQRRTARRPPALRASRTRPAPQLPTAAKRRGRRPRHRRTGPHTPRLLPAPPCTARLSQWHTGMSCVETSLTPTPGMCWCSASQKPPSGCRGQGRLWAPDFGNHRHICRQLDIQIVPRRKWKRGTSCHACQHCNGQGATVLQYLAPIVCDEPSRPRRRGTTGQNRMHGRLGCGPSSDGLRRPMGARRCGCRVPAAGALNQLARTRVVCHSPDARSSTLTATAAASSAAGGGSRRRRAANHRATASSGAHPPH